MPSVPGRIAETIRSVAGETGFSPDAVESMMRSIARGGGRMAQFDHPAFGGSGQWMRGGMVMTSGPADRELERRIDRLCEALSTLAVQHANDDPTGSFQTQHQTADGVTHVQDSRAASGCGTPWYPAALGEPDTSGSQNQMRYAWFAAARRLAVDDGRAVTVYDTGEHRIGGVSQQQGGRGTVSFTSQHGALDLARLPPVDAPDAERAPTTVPASRGDSASDPFAAIAKLAELHAKGILDDREFATKKAELLRRI